jgi:hypothetical protein
MFACLDRWSWVILAALVVMGCGTIFAANNPVPFINLPVAPAAAVPGGAGFTLTVNGAGFISGSVVNWNGSPRTTTFVSAGQVTAEILVSDIATASTASITVTNPVPGGGISNPSPFEVSSPVASPIFTGLALNPSANGPLTTADFNGDGKLDIAYASAEGTTIFLSLGNGDGTFQPPFVSSAGEVFLFVAFAGADFNRDGKLDLAVLFNQFGFGGAALLLGNGDGTLKPFTEIPGVSSGPGAMLVADFNQDGNLDVMVGGCGCMGPFPSIELLLGDGDGTFQTGATPPIGGTVMTVGDFNGDGKLDIVTAGLNGQIALGNGDGTFQAPQTFFMANDGSSAVVAADVNGDGKLDLIFGTSSSGIGVMQGNGDGTFQPAVFYSTEPNQVGGSVATLSVGDLNADGKLDVLASNNPANPSPLALLLGNGDGTFQAAIGYPIQVQGAPFALGDFNNDGKMDFASASAVYLQGPIPAATLAPPVLNFPGQGIGTTSTAQTVTFSNTGTGPLTLSAIGITGANASDFKQTNTCPSSLAVGASCRISVTFSPTGGGGRSASLKITDSAPGSPQTATLSGTGQDFTFTAPTPLSLSVAAGQTANYTFNIEPLAGFTQTVTLTCGGAPDGAKCTVPGSITLSSGMTVAVSVTTTAGAAAMLPGSGHWLACGLFALPFVVSLAGVGVRRPRARIHRWVWLLLIVAATSLVPACGEGNGGGGGGKGTPAGTYQLTVVGKYTAGVTTLTHTATITLIVE